MAERLTVPPRQARDEAGKFTGPTHTRPAVSLRADTSLDEFAGALLHERDARLRTAAAAEGVVRTLLRSAAPGAASASFDLGRDFDGPFLALSAILDEGGEPVDVDGPVYAVLCAELHKVGRALGSYEALRSSGAFTEIPGAGAVERFSFAV